MINAYIEEYKKLDKFVNNGLPISQKEYDELVIEHFKNNVVRNEIHGLLNEYAQRILLAVKDKDHGLAERCAGAMESLERLLKKSEEKIKKVSVVK